MVSALLGTALLGGFRTETLRRFGLGWSGSSLPAAATGAGLALSLLVAYATLAAIVGQADWLVRERTVWRWVEAVAGAFGTAVLIALAEEYLFRGFVFTSLRDRVFRSRTWPSITVTSAIYALIHFIDVRKTVIGPDPGVCEGLQLVLAPARALGDWATTWPAAVGLFLFGMVLNDSVVRTRSLYPSIGLHAGSVLFIRLVKSFFAFPAVRSAVWGTYRVYDGVAGWGLMIAMAVASRIVFRSTVPHEDSDSPVPASR